MTIVIFQVNSVVPDNFNISTSATVLVGLNFKAIYIMSKALHYVIGES